MQIGSILEKKILTAYCRHEQLQLHKTRGVQTLKLLHGYNYVGHTPDGRTIKTAIESLVLEVKVVFSKIDLAAQLQKHVHQLQLGLWVHHCKEGRLIVYNASSDMSVHEAYNHEIDMSRMESTSFKKDNEWWVKFKKNIEKFYEEHLQWFYEDELDMEQTTCKIEGLLSSMRTDKPTGTNLKKRKRSPKSCN
jgi:hypothetical protein